MSQETNGPVVDAQCRAMTASWVRDLAKGQEGKGGKDSMAIDNGIELCDFYEGFESAGGMDALLHGVYSLDDLRYAITLALIA